MKNAIVITSIGPDAGFRYCIESVKPYAEKYGLDIELITQKKFGLPDHLIHFEKFQVYDMYDWYDRILLLDSDIIIKPNCPNVFDVFPEDHICGVREDGFKPRGNEINMIQSNMGPISWNGAYVNVGVLLVDKSNRWIYELTDQSILGGNLGSFREQNVINWRISKENAKFLDMGFQYNRMKFSERVVSKDDAYILHYAGPKQNKTHMEEDFDRYIR